MKNNHQANHLQTMTIITHK